MGVNYSSIRVQVFIAKKIQIFQLWTTANLALKIAIWVNV